MKKILIILYVFTLIFISIPLVGAVSYGWGFKKNNNNTTPDIGVYAKEIEGTSSYYVGDTNQKIVYLTFDTGYDNGVLSGILDVLKEKQVSSTFFITGDFIEPNKELILRMVNENHFVGNHTWSHKNITKLTFEELENQISKVEMAYRDLTNQEMVKFFRPPAGEFNRDALLNVKRLGYSTFFWSLAYKDWDIRKQRGGDYAFQMVMENIHNGAIILMHTVSSDNLEALPKIIDELRNQGYTIKNLDYIVKNE